MSLTLRQVQIFLAVAQSDSISDAGAILGITKSAVSQAITDLETRLGVNLFERSKGRAVLSAEGRAFKVLLTNSCVARTMQNTFSSILPTHS